MRNPAARTIPFAGVRIRFDSKLDFERVLSNLRAEGGEMTLQHIRSRRHVLGRRAVPLDDRRNDAGRCPPHDS